MVTVVLEVTGITSLLHPSNRLEGVGVADSHSVWVSKSPLGALVNLWCSVCSLSRVLGQAKFETNMDAEPNCQPSPFKSSSKMAQISPSCFSFKCILTVLYVVEVYVFHPFTPLKWLPGGMVIIFHKPSLQGPSNGRMHQICILLLGDCYGILDAC